MKNIRGSVFQRSNNSGNNSTSYSDNLDGVESRADLYLNQIVRDGSNEPNDERCRLMDDSTNRQVSDDCRNESNMLADVTDFPIIDGETGDRQHDDSETLDSKPDGVSGSDEPDKSPDCEHSGFETADVETIEEIENNSDSEPMLVSASEMTEIISKAVGDVIKDNLMELVKHNDEALESLKYDLKKGEIEAQRKAIEALIKLQDQFSRIIRKYEENSPELFTVLKENYPDIIRFEGRITKQLNSLGVDTRSVELGTPVDEVIDFAVPQYAIACPDPEKWGTISKLLSKYYYVQGDDILQVQTVEVFDEKDREY